MFEYSATGAFTLEMNKSVPESLVKEAVNNVHTEIGETGLTPDYAYTIVVTRVFEYTHPLDGNDYLEIDMKFHIDKEHEEDILLSPKSARVTYQKNYIWEPYTSNVSWITSDEKQTLIGS